MANTNAKSKFFISEEPQPSNLTQSAFAALDWIEVKGIGSVGETGVTTNMLNYDTWDDEVSQMAKGISNAGAPEIELARIPTDPGQIAMRAAALTNMNYAYKVERNDKATLAGTPTVLYNRGLITGPRRPNGRNEDFDLEVFTLGLQQLEIVVNPT